MSCARYTQSRSFAELVSQLQEENLDHLEPLTSQVSQGLNKSCLRWFFVGKGNHFNLCWSTFHPLHLFFCDMTMIRQSGQNSSCSRQVEATGIEIHWVLWSCSFPDSTVAQDGPARDLSVDVVITLYGMAAVLIYMMLIGDFMSDIVARPVLLPPPSWEPWNIYHFISTYSTILFSQIIWVAWARIFDAFIINNIQSNENQRNQKTQLHKARSPLFHLEARGSTSWIVHRLHRPLLSVTGLTTLGDYGFALGGFSLVYSSWLSQQKDVFSADLDETNPGIPFYISGEFWVLEKWWEY